MQRHDDLQPLAQVIRTYRRATGQSQEGFAYQADIDRGFMGAVERAERNVGFRKIRRLLIALHVTWREFGRALDEIDPLIILSEAEREVATQTLRLADERQRQALRDLGQAIVQRLTTDEAFAILAANEAPEILPCAVTRQLERIARGDRWHGMLKRVSDYRQLLALLRDSRRFRDAAVSDPQIAACMAESSTARAAANAAGKYLRTHVHQRRREHA